MRLPAIRGVIERRILVNYRVDAAVLSGFLPPPFRPKLIRGSGIAGICLIRLRDIRPTCVPGSCGLSSENAAHRVAVQWEEVSEVREGVYVPRRDTNARWAVLGGGRVSPGAHHLADFHCRETADRLEVCVQSDDGATAVAVSGRVASSLPAGSLFGSLAEASRFFEGGSVGYSATALPSRFDGLELRCHNWSMTPLDVEEVQSSFFEDASLFPQGSVEFDCALLMRDIQHEWHSKEDLCCPIQTGA
jgi:hypothetical protein